jgi:hypothetical protein
MAGPFRVTVYTALPGTPLLDEHGRPDGSSAAGHMWYQVSDGQVGNSYGFAPKEHGAASGPGKGYRTDTSAYQSPAYSRTMEITPEQYAQLKQFGEAAVKEDWSYFKGNYNGATNSCVDFTWGALKHAGFEIHRPQVAVHDGTVVTPEYSGPIESHFEGRLKPGHNKADIQQIVPPVPGSPLNSEQTNSPPKDRSLMQHLLSENDASPAQRETAQQFKDQLGERLGKLGMSDQQVDTLAAAAAKEHTRHAGQGDVQSFYLSKDGGTIAMRQEYAPLREFEVGKALGQSEHNHWGEAISMEREKTQDLASPHAGPTHAAPSHQMDAPVLSRG